MANGSDNLSNPVFVEVVNLLQVKLVVKQKHLSVCCSNGNVSAYGNAVRKACVERIARKPAAHVGRDVEHLLGVFLNVFQIRSVNRDSWVVVRIFVSAQAENLDGGVVRA